MVHDLRHVWSTWSGLLEDTEKKRPPSPVTAMKKFSKFWFQQDGAKAHTADLTLDLVETHFKKRVISNCFLLKKKVGWSWLPYSLDLSPLDNFLRGYVKDLCYANNNFGSAKKYHRYFQLALRGSGHFLVRSRNFIVTVTIGHSHESSDFKKLNFATLYNGH